MINSVKGYSRLLNRELHLKIKKKIEKEIIVDFEISDFKHLMGAQYFESEISKLKQCKAHDFFDDALNGGFFTERIMKSEKYSDYADRVMLTGKIKNILYNDYCVYDYVKLPGKHIQADYFLVGTLAGKTTYLFIRKRKYNDHYGPVSIFYKDVNTPKNRWFEHNQRPYLTRKQYIKK